MNKRPDGTWPTLRDGDRRPTNSIKLRSLPLHDELPLWARRLREQARRRKISATKSDRSGGTRNIGEKLRYIAQAMEDAADLLEQRGFKLTLRTDREHQQ